ncbi:MAG: ZPR1 zinc finger domain-containing protein [Candidatus Lokiarchaeota archaeon]|jgi:zinc finger protein|nr:ZPR1 zinc finger domain-containing protein [Candidatus Lokiarchaeota archaeon]
MTQEEFSIMCPACKKGIIKIIKTVYDLPDKDKMLILKFECDKCSFLKNDIIPLTTNMDPGIMTLKITHEEDLKSKIYRSPLGKLEIPELELIVEPGPRADFYYTNVEGILLRFENAVSIYRNNLEEDDHQIVEIEQLQKDLKKAMKGRLKFTLIITDTQGGSYIIPHDKSKYTFEKLKKNDLE